jgi:gliding motility-associated-like protein
MCPVVSRLTAFVCCFFICNAVLVAQTVPSLRARMQELDSLHAIQYKQFRGKNNKRIIHPQAGSVKRQYPVATSRSGSMPAQSPNLTICYDTSGRFFLYNDTITLYPLASTLSADGKILVTGEFVDWRVTPVRSGGFIMKSSDSGEVAWMRTWDTLLTNTGYDISWYYRIVELQDGSIAIAGHSNDRETENDDLSILRVSSTGSLIWNRVYKSRFWTRGNGSADYFWIKDMKQDPVSSDLFLTAAHWSQGVNVTRIRFNNGDIVWSNLYAMDWGGSFHHPFGIEFSPANELLVASKPNSHFVGIWKLNPANGDTISSRYYQIPDPSGFNIGFLTTEGFKRLNNGHYVIYGRQYRYFRWPVGNTDPLSHAGVLELDGNFNVVRADSYRNDVESNSYNTRITVHRDGSGFFSMLRLISGYTADVYYVQFREGQIMKQRVRFYLGEGMPEETQATQMTDGGDMIVKILGDTINNINKIEFLHLHASDTSSNCLGIASINNFVTPYKVEDFTLGRVVISNNDLSPSRQKTLLEKELPLTFIPGCRQVSHCDTLSLVPAADTFCVSSPVTIVFRRNKACGATPFIKFDTSMVQFFRVVNDSTFEFQFNKPGRTTINGSIFGCALIEDSVTLTILQSPGAVTLGPDTVLCEGNTIRLAAKKGYKSYRWQDGTADSTFTVTRPGEYWVVTTDSCGNQFSDTMQVAPHPPIPFDLGNDLRICEKDTIAIAAPSSFFNYSWSPNYNMVNPLVQTVSVFPARDTTYIVRAEKSPGCFVTDSIRVFVNAAPSIQLGADQSFCNGDSLVLNAGPGFVQYQWSSGASSPGITVRNAGLYIVNALTADGCRSTDSLRVLSVHANPLVNLGADMIVCEGSTIALDAGNFSIYDWNTGASSRTISISQTGTYAVTVTDNNGCRGADTLVVYRAVPPPARFLQDDTTICTYARFELLSNTSFKSYSWNTGSSSSSITVTKPGLYWLEVKDNDNCAGRDSILVTGKDCLKGFFAPTGFTPNRDGRNDVFRPLIFGPIVKYELQVFNRWGQRVFRSTDHGQGWDGGAVPQAGGYTWVCVYQFDGEKPVTERGTVVLIR